LQEVVILLSKLITQIGLILTSKADHLFDALGMIQLENRKAGARCAGFSIYYKRVLSVPLTR
jgi:hypothetical protein